MALLNGAAARMVAETTLRCVGDCSVTIAAAVPVNEDSSDGLGLGAAMQQEWELEPAFVRWKTENDEQHRELVVGAETVERVFGLIDVEAFRALLLRSQVRVDGELLRATEVSPESHERVVYLYRVRLER